MHRARRGRRARRRDDEIEAKGTGRPEQTPAGLLSQLQRDAGNRAVAATAAVFRDRSPEPRGGRGTLSTVMLPPGVRTTSKVLSWRLVGGGKHRTADGKVETGSPRLVVRIRKGPPAHPLGLGEIHAGAQFNEVRLKVDGGKGITFYDATVVLYDGMRPKTPEVTFTYGRMAHDK